MGATTGIEWTDATWNPIIGCSRVSEGCRNCYAESIAGRFGNGKLTVYSGLTRIVNGRAVWTGQIAETKQLLEPLSWRKPKRVFVNSMSDLSHENVPDDLIDKIFAVMALCPQHTFQVLTKRPKRMNDYIRATTFCAARASATWPRRLGDSPCAAGMVDEWPLSNVWLGVSVENQAAADARIPLLLQTSAAVRFISAEPLLGEVDLSCIPWPANFAHATDGPGSDGIDALRFDDSNSLARLGRLDWVIGGGESGPHARPMRAEWAQLLRDQCAAAGVAFFFKQWGEWLPSMQDGAIRDGQEINCSDQPVRVGKHAAGALLDGREHKAFPGSRS